MRFLYLPLFAFLIIPTFADARDSVQAAVDGRNYRLGIFSAEECGVVIRSASEEACGLNSSCLTKIIDGITLPSLYASAAKPAQDLTIQAGRGTLRRVYSELLPVLDVDTYVTLNQKLNYQLSCVAPENSESPEFLAFVKKSEVSGSSCAGRWIGADAGAELKKQQELARAKYVAAKDSSDQAKEDLEHILNAPFLAQAIDFSLAVSLAQKVSASEEGRAAAQSLKAFFGDLHALRSKLESLAQADAANLQVRLEAAVAKWQETYYRKRVVSRYLSVLSSGESVRDFCAEDYRLQLRDKRYQESGHPLLGYVESSWKFAKLGMTEGEYSSIYDYTNGFHTTINHEIYLHGTLNEDLENFRQITNAGLDRLPLYMKKVKRLVTLPYTVLKEHFVGAILDYPAFTSTSKNMNWSDWDGLQVLYLYPGVAGKDVSEISTKYKEEEVLFKAGVRFKVLDRREEDGKTTLYMAEVDAKGHVISEQARKDFPGTAGE